MRAGLGQGREQRVAAGDESPQQLGPAGELACAASDKAPPMNSGAPSRRRLPTLPKRRPGRVTRRWPATTKAGPCSRRATMSSHARSTSSARARRDQRSAGTGIARGARRPGAAPVRRSLCDRFRARPARSSASRIRRAADGRRCRRPGKSRRRRPCRGLDLGLPAVEAGDPRRACRLARDHQAAVGARQSERGRGQRIVVGDGRDVGFAMLVSRSWVDGAVNAPVEASARNAASPKRSRSGSCRTLRRRCRGHG